MLRRLTLALLFGLALIATAQAQTTCNFVDNVIVTAAQLNTCLNPAVSSNATLKNLTGSSNNTTVFRRGFATAGDGGDGTYTWSGSPCSLNGGAGDNGSQIAPNSGSGCWLLDAAGKLIVPQVFGAKGDGTTNDRPALQAWINFGQSTTPSPSLWIPTPSVYYNLTDGISLLVSKSIYIDGPGLALDTLAQQFTCPAGTPTLHWASNTAAPVLRVSSATSHNTLYGGTLKGFCADGNYKATSVQVSSTQQWHIDIAEVKMTVAGLQVDDCNGNGAVGGAGLSMGNYIDRNYYNFGAAGLGADTSDGVRLDASCTTTGVTNTHVGLLVSSTRDGDGFNLRGGDADQAVWVFPFRDPGGTGNGIAFRCVTPGNICGRTSQILMGQGQVLGEAGVYGVNIAFLHSEGSGVTLQGTPGVDQAQIQYHTVDNGSGAWYKAHDDYLIYDELTIPASAWTGAQFPGSGCVGVLTAPAAATTSTMTFSATPGCVGTGQGVADITQAVAGTTLGVASGTTVSGQTGTTVSLSTPLVGSGLASGDTVAFANQAAIVTADTAQVFGKSVLFPANVNGVAVATALAPVKWAAGQITGLKIYGYYDGNCSGTDKFQVDAGTADFTLGTTVLGNDATGFPQNFTPTTSGQKNAGMLIPIAFGTTLPTASRYGMQFRLTRQSGGTCQGLDFFMSGMVLVFGAGGPSVNAVGPWQVATPPWHAP